MRDHLHKALKPIKDKSGLWWLFFWKWPELLRECHGEINQLTSDLSMVREKFRNEQSRCEAFEKLANESREMAAAAANRASAEKSLSQNLSEELGYAKVQLQKSSETAAGLENKVTRMEMEMERVKAELAKTQADLTRSGLELERERRIQQDTRRDLTLLREFVHRTHRLDIPTRRGVKAMLANGSRLIAFLALLLPMVLLSAPFPPPFFRGVYTTNTAAWAQTNVISLSTTNATSKPLTNHYQDGVLTLFGLEAGANITLIHNGSNIVITGSAGGSGLTTNANQFLGVPLSIKSGALETNVTFWQSNALLPALIATNQPGGTIDLVTMLTTNGAGLRVTSNGAVVVRGVIGSTTNSFEVRRSNNAAAIFGVTHSNTVRIVGPSQAGYGATLVIQSEEGSTQNNIELFAGSVLSGRWRSDNAGNQIISAEGGGELQFNYDGASSGRIAMGVPGIGNVWYMVPSAAVAAWHGGTARRGQITNVWDIWGRTNLWLTRTGLLDGIVVTNDIRFLGHNSTSNDVWVCTNTVTGEGEWRSYGLPQLSDVADTMGVGVFHGDLLSFDGNMELWTNNTPNVSQFTAATFPLTLRDGVTVTNPNSIGLLHVTNKAGVDRAIRFWNTNGLGYSEFGVVTQAWLPTNKFLLSITNPVVGEVLEIQSVSYADGVANIVITNAPDNSGGGGGLTTNANQFGASVELTIKNGAFLTNMNYFGTGTNDGSFYSQHHFPLADDTYNFGSPNLNWVSNYARYYRIFDPAGVRWITLSAPPLSADYSLVFPDAQGANGQVITNNGSGTLGWWTPVSGGGGLTTNANQFGESVELTIKSGVLLTNALFYPSNLTSPATIHLATTDQITNLTEWRSTNSSVCISVSSNACALVYGRLDMSNAVAFRTNNIDFRLPVYQAFTNSLQTNLVLQLTNVYEGVTHRIDAYGSGRLGGGRTNAWQILCTVAANRFIYWPPGTTNGNFDVLVNSNQIVSFTFMGGLGSTNILASYRVLEGIGVN